MGVNSAAAIAKRFMLKNRNFCKYDLSDNNIGNEGTKAIAEVLKVTGHIISLDLSKNNVTADGAAYLADALLRNSSLVELNLAMGETIGASRNKIGK